MPTTTEVTTPTTAGPTGAAPTGATATTPSGGPSALANNAIGCCNAIWICGAPVAAVQPSTPAPMPAPDSGSESLATTPWSARILST